jgi:predicted RNA-binding Zn-ribbon protein involved in translation (DUF1610 family)
MTVMQMVSKCRGCIGDVVGLVGATVYACQCGSRRISRKQRWKKEAVDDS